MSGYHETCLSWHDMRQPLTRCRQRKSHGCVQVQMLSPGRTWHDHGSKGITTRQPVGRLPLKAASPPPGNLNQLNLLPG